MTELIPGCGPHLALQLRDRFGVLGLGGLWQLGVEALRQALHPVLLVFSLDETETRRLSVNTLTSTSPVRDPYLALQVGHLGSELRLGRLRQLGVQTGGQGLLPALLVLVL